MPSAGALRRLLFIFAAARTGERARAAGAARATRAARASTDRRQLWSCGALSLSGERSERASGLYLPDAPPASRYGRPAARRTPKTDLTDSGRCRLCFRARPGWYDRKSRDQPGRCTRCVCAARDGCAGGGTRVRLLITGAKIMLRQPARPRPPRSRGRSLAVFRSSLFTGERQHQWNDTVTNCRGSRSCRAGQLRQRMSHRWRRHLAPPDGGIGGIGGGGGSAGGGAARREKPWKEKVKQPVSRVWPPACQQ